jgi:hypothetical protein
VLAELGRVEFVNQDPGADLRGDGRSGRGADDDVRTPQTDQEIRIDIPDPAQNADLPGDARYAAAGQDEGTCHCANTAFRSRIIELNPRPAFGIVGEPSISQAKRPTSPSDGTFH